MCLPGSCHTVCENCHVETLEERLEVWCNYNMSGLMTYIIPCSRTFCCKELLLRSLHLINPIERKGKLLQLVLGIRDANNVKGATLLARLAAYNNVFAEFFVQERPDPRDN